MGYLETKLDAVAATVTEEAARTRARLEDAAAETVRGLRIDGARSVSLSGVAQSRVIAGAGGVLVGWSVLASAGPVRVVFHDGGSAAGDVIGVIDLADQEHDNQPWPEGISYAEGLFIEVTGTGTGLIGAVYLRAAR